MADESISNAKEVKVGDQLIQDKTTIGFTKTEESIECSTGRFQQSVGWKTQLLMWLLYLGAILSALLHLLMFLILRGKTTQGDKSIPQSYVTTASNILASIHSACINAALAVAFNQYLWRVFRKPLKVSTIEALYTMRSNPLSLFTREGIWRAPVLLFIALLIWTTGLVTSFPPGALTVVQRQLIYFENNSVPTFDPYDKGGENISSILSAILAPMGLGQDSNNSIEFILSDQRLGPLQRLATTTMVGGQPLLMPSPCGLNCSYMLGFEGPAVSCTTNPKSVISLENYAADGDLDQLVKIYEGTWWNPPSNLTQTNNISQLNTPNLANFTAVQSQLLGFAGQNSTADLPGVVESKTIECIPSSTHYELSVTYINSVRSISTSTGPSRNLSSFLQGTKLFDCPVTCNCCDEYTSCDCLVGPLWTEEKLGWLRDANILTLIDAVLSPLSGSYLATTGEMNETPPPFQVNLTTEGANNAIWVTPPAGMWDVQYRSNKQLTGPQNNTIVANTLINQDLIGEAFSSMRPPTLNFSESILNELLQNVTISTFNALNVWHATVNTTISTNTPVYAFSHRLNLFVPYSLTLLVPLPFLIVGTVSLLRNGLPAESNSFVQLLVSLTGSRTLQQHVESRLRGVKGKSRLYDLHIQFGVLKGADNGESTNRTGFGVPHEVVPLE